MFLLPSHVPPSVSSPWKHVTESVYPHFPILPFFCDMMASCCFEIWRWRGEKKHTSLMWCRKTSKEFASPFDLEVIRWVIVGGGGVFLVNSWQLDYCHIARDHQRSEESKYPLIFMCVPFKCARACVGIVLVWYHQTVCVCECVSGLIYWRGLSVNNEPPGAATG